MRNIENKQNYNAVDLLAKEIAKAADLNAGKYEYDKTFTSLILKNNTGVSSTLTDSEKSTLGECDTDYYYVRINGNFYKIKCVDANFPIDEEVRVKIPNNNWSKMYIDFRKGSIPCVSPLNYIQNGLTVTLTWKLVSGLDGIMIFKKADNNFSSIFDGEMIYQGNAETYIDTLDFDFKDYYYRCISYKGKLYNDNCEVLKINKINNILNYVIYNYGSYDNIFLTSGFNAINSSLIYSFEDGDKIYTYSESKYDFNLMCSSDYNSNSGYAYVINRCGISYSFLERYNTINVRLGYIDYYNNSGTNYYVKIYELKRTFENYEYILIAEKNRKNNPEYFIRGQQINILKFKIIPNKLSHYFIQIGVETNIKYALATMAFSGLYLTNE